MTFFDSLVHATPDGVWLGGTRYDASLERLLLEMDKAGVERACLVSIANYIDNAYVQSVARAYPDRFVPVAGLDPGSIADEHEVTNEIAKLKEAGFAGVKLHSRLNQYDPLDARCLAAIDGAGKAGLVVFLDTLFRQPNRSTRYTADIVDEIATKCQHSQIVLLHAGGASMLELFEMGRMHPHLLLDLSFTILRYAGSSLDLDIRFLVEQLDQRVTIGSDFPEYVPSQALERLLALTEGIPKAKLENVLFRNLFKLFDMPPVQH